MNETNVTNTQQTETNTPAGGTVNTGNDGGNQAGSKTFTQDELNKVLADRLAKEKEKNATAITEAVNTAIQEYERKAKLSQEEKDKEEREKRERETADRERNITLRERTIEAKDLLLEKKIPTTLVDFIVDIDSDKMQSNIEKFTTAWNKAVEDGVTNKLKGTPPEDFGGSNNNKGGAKKIVTAF